MANIFGLSKEWLLIIFGLTAWLVSNSRRPILYVISALPIFAYAYAVVWGVSEGLVIMRGLVAALAYITVAVLAIITIRQEIQNSINSIEIKKIREQEKERRHG